MSNNKCDTFHVVMLEYTLIPVQNLSVFLCQLVDMDDNVQR